MAEAKPVEGPKVFTVEPARLRCGLWGYPEGDISASYSADTYALSGKLRRAFRHASLSYVMMGREYSGFASRAKAYPLIPAGYYAENEQYPDTPDSANGYAGNSVCYKETEFIFGALTLFEQRAFSEKELVDLFRRMYAYGGYFAAEAGSYDNLLLNWLKRYDDPALKKALLAELDHSDLPQERTAMRAFIEEQARLQSGSYSQLTLF